MSKGIYKQQRMVEAKAYLFVQNLDYFIYPLNEDTQGEWIRGSPFLIYDDLASLVSELTMLLAQSKRGVSPEKEGYKIARQNGLSIILNSPITSLKLVVLHQEGEHLTLHPTFTRKNKKHFLTKSISTTLSDEAKLLVALQRGLDLCK